ncbi:MAG: DMT family transporter [Casimicrobiaceae bacterium]|nr:DMT family transporter [Casimicrobiaceae bacterium]MCX8097900.1 DMT family transporter [Casimicrobiaceae bacterium]MDW8313041.1 DMT family transporter [Burkholderiales bacterium]
MLDAVKQLFSDVPARTVRRRAIVLLLGGLVFLIGLDACGKYLGEHGVPVAASTWARYAGHLAIVLLVCWPHEGRMLLRAQHPPLQWARGALMLAVTLLYFAALKHLPLAEATALFFLTPIATTALAVWWLRERPGLWTWLAMLLGFLGVLVVMRPGGELPLIGVLFALAAALGNAAYQTLTRAATAQGRNERTSVQLFYSGWVGALVMTLAAPLWLSWDWLEHMTGTLWLVFAATGALGAAGHWLLIRAYALVPANVVMPWAYLQLLFSIVLGALVFGSFPDAVSLAGMAVIGLAPQLTRFDHRGGTGDR